MDSVQEVDNSSISQYGVASHAPSSSSSTASRYENQKCHDWNTFMQYLKNHRPPLPLSWCNGAHVLEFLRYLDQFGKTKVHTPICPFYGYPNPPAPCPCPFRQAWGYGQTDCRYLSYLGISRRAVTISPCSSHSDHKICTQVNVRSFKCSLRGIISFVCRAGPGGHRRNPDFSRQIHGYRGKNRQNEDRENFENLDESEMISSKNGPLLSLSGSTKFQATAAPGPREEEFVEIVEHFRKIQAELRERTAAKEDKKTKASQGKGKESDTVDSLHKLLTKHSVEQGKKKNSNGSNRDLNLDIPEVNGSSNEDKRFSFFGSNGRVRSETKESYAPSLSRPASNFRKKSPVPQMKYQTLYSDEEMVNSMTHVNSDRKRNSSLAKSHPAVDDVPELEEELESGSDPELESESIYQESDMWVDLSEDESSDVDEEDGEQHIEHEDLSALKLPELRALANSRGLKGFSKMKKSDLVLAIGYPINTRYCTLDLQELAKPLHVALSQPDPLRAKENGAHVLEFLRYLDRFCKTKVHTPICPFYGYLNPPAPCPCPFRQAWEIKGKPEANPFGTRAVRLYLREVCDLQSKARGISYEKKKRKRPSSAHQQTPSLPLPWPRPPPPGAC
ncbi:hypothetical protein CXB51_020371 [Gossypium anomalum]|uniref:ALOG domain-containing protein n=1 Tax=Gossypium anomalum TaxID=47600 RepID=A0A8J5YUJ8_9ROSI|nr:hypothetical protein CXB51_020371 [Gossypium anomalum]